VRTVNAVPTGGTVQLMVVGQPESVVALRQRVAMALLICDGSTAPLSGSA
jgi:hypothetical protein